MSPLRQFLHEVQREKHASKLVFAYLFGSQVAGAARKDSDTDLCLYYELPERALQRLLVTLKGLAPKEIDVSLFQLLPLPVRNEVFKGKPLFVRNKPFLYDLAFRTFREFEDFAPRYRFTILNTPSAPKRFMI